jgi:serine/threonine protein kinase
MLEQVQGYVQKRKWQPFRLKCGYYFAKTGRGAPLDYEKAQKFFDLAGRKSFGKSLSYLLDEGKFERFDFTGTDTWNFTEAFRCLKRSLVEELRNAGGMPQRDVRFTTPEKEGIEKIKQLGEGGQAQAWLAESEGHGEVCLKIMDKSNPDASAIDELIEEHDLLRKLDSSPYVVKCYEIFEDQSNLYAVQEVLHGGDLESLHAHCEEQGVDLTEEYFQDLFKQCLLGLEHMHRNATMHCDIKEANIMLKTTNLEFPSIAIIDMGLATACAGHCEAGGTPGYIPPETNKDGIWYPKGDVFSMGVTFFQLLSGMVPCDDPAQAGVFQEGARYISDEIWEKDVVYFTATRPIPTDKIADDYPGTLDWLPAMLEKNRHDRPTCAELLREPSFAHGGDCVGCCVL